MKRFYNFLAICIILIVGFNISVEAQIVYYVGNGGDWHDWDIYSYDIGSSVETRLTTDPAIDNHPVISHFDPTRIAWSANRDNADFDLYVADVSDMEGTLVRLTDDSYPGETGQGPYPDRHPHWHPNGQLIIFTTKNRLYEFVDIPTTTCSHPVIKKKFYEGMNVIKLTPAGTAVESYTPLDVVDAWDQTTNPDIWKTTPDVYVGHPSFNHVGDKIVFTAAIDGEGKNWEVYIVGFDPVGIAFLPNSLLRVTYGPNNIDNPIKMSGGATFSNDDLQIIFNSTRITAGNSQIYTVPASSVDIPVNSATQLTFHRGNDYVPEPLSGSSALLITSDLGPVNICDDCITGPGPTMDLDVVLIDGGTRTVLGTDSHQQTLLIADEVSWFCGLKPNLSSCTSGPRVMDVESLWLEAHPFDLLPPDILYGYGSDYSTNGQALYQTGWNNTSGELNALAPDILAALYEDMTALWEYTPSFPGYGDPQALQEWLDGTKEMRNKKYVMPIYMNLAGLISTSSIIDYLNPLVIPSGCGIIHNDMQTLYISAPPSGYYTGSPPVGSFVVESGGSADLTAGCNIIFLPGTTVESGGYLSASIVPITPSYCPTGPSTPTENLALVKDLPVNYSNPRLRFKIYPNPATESFWVELLDEEGKCSIQIEIYNFRGHKLLDQNRQMVKRIQISFPNQPPGPYVVKLTKGNLTGNQTVILN